jgi:stage V sporulation protein G
MEITDVRIKLVRDRGDRLQAFCLITFDEEFVVRDVKIIKGNNSYFVAMPSRKTTDHCDKCGCKNHLRAKFCNDCGTALPVDRAGGRAGTPPKFHADVAHPVTSACRSKIQDAVLEAFEKELEASKQPGYRSAEFDEVDEEVPEVIH